MAPQLTLITLFATGSLFILFFGTILIYKREHLLRHSTFVVNPPWKQDSDSSILPVKANTFDHLNIALDKIRCSGRINVEYKFSMLNKWGMKIHSYAGSYHRDGITVSFSELGVEWISHLGMAYVVDHIRKTYKYQYLGKHFHYHKLSQKFYPEIIQLDTKHQFENLSFSKGNGYALYRCKSNNPDFRKLEIVVNTTSENIHQIRLFSSNNLNEKPGQKKVNRIRLFINSLLTPAYYSIDYKAIKFNDECPRLSGFNDNNELLIEGESSPIMQKLKRYRLGDVFEAQPTGL